MRRCSCWGLVVAAVALLFLASSAWANTIPDAGITIGGGSHSTPVPGLTFSFNAGTGTFSSVDFQNASGVDWFNLQFTGLATSSFPAPDLSCGSIPTLPILFNDCTTSFTLVSTDPNTGVNTFDITILFFNDPSMGLVGSGICSDVTNTNCNDFTVDGMGWEPNSTIFGTANVPEPGTLLLVLSGLGGLFGRRRRLLKG